jgi:hypothetical protein
MNAEQPGIVSTWMWSARERERQRERERNQDQLQDREATRHQWLMPVILATWEAEIRRLQPRQIAHDTPSPK